MSARKGSHMLFRFCEDSVEMMPKLISCSAAWAAPRTEPASSVDAARTRLIRLNMQSTPSADGHTGVGITGTRLRLWLEPAGLSACAHDAVSRRLAARPAARAPQDRLGRWDAARRGGR